MNSKIIRTLISVVCLILIVSLIYNIFTTPGRSERWRNTEQKYQTQKIENAKLYNQKISGSITTSEGTRKFSSYVPPSPTKLLLVLHGGGGSNDKIDQSTGLSKTFQNEDQTILVFPQAIDNNWNDGRVDNKGELLRKTDDLDFVDKLITQFQQDYNIETKNTTISGLSNGAIFSNYYGCNTNKVAKIFSVVGSFPISEPIIKGCSNSSVERILMVNSNNDRIVKNKGGNVGPMNLGQTQSVDTAIAIWSNSGKSIKNYYLNKEGHVWPRDEIDASKLLLEFTK
jgi:poly(3-hydroxybutyrate) depolymerase